MDLFCVARPPGRPLDAPPDNFHERAAGCFRAVHGTSLAERLPLPELSLPGHEVLLELPDRDGQRPALAGWPQTRIQLVEPPLRAQLRHDLDDPLRQLAEEVLIRRCFAFGRVRPRVSRDALRFIEEHDVQVAVVVGLPAPQLSHGGDQERGRCHRRARPRRCRVRRSVRSGARFLASQSAGDRLPRCRKGSGAYREYLPCPRCL